MSKNPLINATLGLLYIALVSSVMFFGMNHTQSSNTVLIPVAVLSLFSLSAAVMGYIFLYQPLQLFLDGKKKQAINLFLQTVAYFAVMTVVLFGLLFSGLFK